MTPRPILEAYIPPPGFKLESLIATTYEADWDFIERQFLPVCLDMPVDFSDQEFKISTCHITILQDIRASALARRLSPRIESLMVSGRKLHSKISVLLWCRENGGNEKRARLVVTSANLTEPGYRENHEIYSSLEFGIKNQAKLAILSAALAHIEAIGRDLSPQLNTQLNEFRRHAKTFTQFELTDAGPEIFVDAEKVVEGLRAEWVKATNTAPEFCAIVSPFWPKGNSDPGKPILNTINYLGLGEDSKLHLIADSSIGEKGKILPVIPSALINSLSSEFKGDLLLAAAKPDYGCDIESANDDDSEEHLNDTASSAADANYSRKLHAKIIFLGGKDVSVLYFGSSNCTRKGLSLNVAGNWEAGLIYRLPGGIDFYKHFAPFADVPVKVIAGKIPQVSEPGDIEADDGKLPVFLTSISVTETHFEFKFNQALVSDLTISMPDALSGERQLGIFSGRPTAGILKVLFSDIIVALPDGSRLPQASVAIRNISPFVELTWDAETAIFPVNFQCKHALPLALRGRELTEEELIEYYTKGFISDGGIEKPGGGHTPAAHTPSDPRRNILAYRVREFIEALRGMEDTVSGSANSLPALETVLFGPRGIIQLANRVANSLAMPPSNGGPRKSAVAAGFQLVELIACLGRIKKGLADSESRGRVAAAREDCRKLLRDITATAPELADSLFQKYSERFGASL